MTNTKSPTMKFKSTYTGPQAPAQASAPQSKRQFGYCNITQYKFKDGDNLLRFLPQPADAVALKVLPPDQQESQWVTFEELNLFSAQFKGKLAMLPDVQLAPELAACAGVSRMRTKAFFELRYAVPEMLKSLANPKGTISLNPSYKVGFQALCHDTGEVVAVVLPGTNPIPRSDGKKRNIGAGVKVCSMPWEADINGNKRYGDIFDIEQGSLVNIRVTNAGTMSAVYEVLHECPMSLVDKPEVIDAIRPFNEVFRFATLSDLQGALSQYLGEQYSLIRGIFPAAPPASDTEDNIPF